jgi:hypothetical protein
MSLSFKNSYSSYLDQREHDAERDLEQSQDPETALEAHHVLQVAEGTRKAFQQTGVSIAQFRRLDGTDHGNTVTMGAYERKATSSGDIGLGDIETISKGSTSTDNITEDVKGTIEHELRHQHSHEEALKNGEAGMITAHFGDDVDHDLQETMARAGTTEGNDAYDGEQSRVNGLASSLKTSRQKLVDLLHKGKEAEIVQIGYESGYLKAA